MRALAAVCMNWAGALFHLNSSVLECVCVYVRGTRLCMYFLEIYVPLLACACIYAPRASCMKLLILLDKSVCACIERLCAMMSTYKGAAVT